jgi:hypothetical protein
MQLETQQQEAAGEGEKGVRCVQRVPLLGTRCVLEGDGKGGGEGGCLSEGEVLEGGGSKRTSSVLEGRKAGKGR